ncbi:DUF4145 domain-containing protein [Pseudomonas aeruginosa]|uniref:DUF4145 domain-containing protein n=1 Tax=Pseudomonas aeruginosa TaxID=287 RepID=UPI002B199413|nr:DUF4145 domain-containing protein [Pseudomonas aeruginosa]MCO3282491.1 DUF4145 domain-containing protein [Pseudomonas aeruginosa]HBO2931998.1 DUF4145 domain-containing protein [Pseudomonas aeruginosa]HEP8170782.1 DUF4145 domain-containing protein [Pseudomonas aeruginosa]
MKFSWCCPFCNHHATITDENFAKTRFEFNKGNKYGYQALISYVITCPNKDCGEYALNLTLHDHVQDGNSPGGYKDLEAKRFWQLTPSSSAKPLPDYVPRAIVEDYNEACAIKDLSPKASATLSRRCIQGMIRDFFAVKSGRLVDEIDAIKDKVDPATWAGIDAVRQIGNIGAHMEKDIDLIVDVEPDEAQLLINLIENLIEDWYVTKHARDERLKALVSIAGEKREQRTAKPS